MPRERKANSSDYGSEVYRFESCRGHLKINKMRVPEGTRFFMLNSAQVGLQALGSVKKDGLRQQLHFRDVDYGALRKTQSAALGNPVEVT